MQRYNRGFEGELYLLTNEHIFCALFQILNFHYTYSFWNLGWAERAENREIVDFKTAAEGI